MAVFTNSTEKVCTDVHTHFLDGHLDNGDLQNLVHGHLQNHVHVGGHSHLRMGLGLVRGAGVGLYNEGLKHKP